MDRPNILIFMTDQQRGDSIPPYSRAVTPNLDRFIKDGLGFSQTYCPAPHCCPSRATFFTGLYPSEHGVWNNVDVGNALSRGPYEGIRLWSEDLKAGGYSLYYTGKWHVSHVETPLDRGWDMKNADSKLKTGEVSKTYKKHKTSEWSQYQKISRQEEKRERKEAEILRPGYPSYTHYGTKDNPFGDKDKIEEAVSKIKSRKKTDKPWCQFVGTNGPHDPYFVPRKYLEMYDINDIKLPDNYYDSMEDRPNIYQRTRQLFTQLTEAEHKEAVRHYLAFCTYEDDLFGKILAALEETGEANNTIVIYLSDHGDYMAEHGLWSKGLPGFISAYHVPFAVRWPDGIKNPGRIINQFISLADFAPTILELAGIKVERKFTGKSILPFIKDEKIDNWRDIVFTQTNGNELYGIQRSVMTRYWKYVFNGFDFDELYNLAEDPLEVNNLINEPGHVEIVRQLSRKMWKFAKKTGDDCISPYIVVGLAPYGPAEAFR